MANIAIDSLNRGRHLAFAMGKVQAVGESDFDLLLAEKPANRSRGTIPRPSFFSVHRAYFLLLCDRQRRVPPGC